MNGIGVDIGGTNTKLIVMNSGNEVLYEGRFDTSPDRGPESFIKELMESVKRLKEEWDPVSVGIGAAGDVDPERGVIRFSPNLNRWRDLAVTRPIEKSVGLPCVLENDANMAAWGAYELELGRKCRNVVAVTLGTGIGGGIIIEGKLYHGANGSAGEVGHNKLSRVGPRCHCGGKGCMEASCGSYAIMRAARRAIKDPRSFIARYSAPGKPRLNTLCLTRAADRGNKTALRIWREMGENLGRGLADLLLILNPDCVVLTGGVSRASRHFLGALKKVFASQEMRTSFVCAKLVVAKNADLGVQGAALLGLERAKKRRKGA